MTTSATDANAFPCGASISIPGPAGLLEAIATCPAGDAAPATVVICHPHPVHGGTMNNKVVTTLVRAFGELGLRTLRFNFRGVGASAGEYAQGVGETEDVLAVLSWVRERRPTDEIWLAGFSFGGYVALRAAAQFPLARLIAVAPAVHLYDELGPPPAPGVPLLVLQGEADEVVPFADVKKWIAGLESKPTVRLFPGVGHFFHGHLNDLRAAVHEELRASVPRE